MTETIVKRKTIITEQDFLPTFLHPIVKQIYLNRGIFKASDLDRDLEHLLPFHDLEGIKAGVSLLYEHLIKQNQILIIGDFDADGATSTAVAMLALKKMGAKNLHYLVPNRFEFGYGLTPEIVEVALKYQPKLIITVDNGISSIEGVRYAKEHQIDVLITDHHLPGQELPLADAIVNPNQLGCPFPSKNLAGVGVIFYVMLALRRYLEDQAWFQQQQISKPNLAELLDLVALGTYADVVPLDRNNRILVYQGLRRIQAGRCRPGILALLQIAGKNFNAVDASSLGFAIGPRLNAAGRLDDMSLGIECLLAEDLHKALMMAKTLNDLNDERRLIESDMKREASGILDRLQKKSNSVLPFGICLYDDSWHQGVIGILAGRIKEQYHRPTIAFAPVNDEEIKGSARSIEGLHIRDLLDEIASSHPHVLKKFGGHAMAAGLSLKKDQLQVFSEIFNECVRTKLPEHLLKKQIWSDGELLVDDFTIPVAEELQKAGPFGQSFPEPFFDGIFEILEQRLVGDKHLKLVLKKEHRRLDAIAFNIDLKKWPNNRAKEIQVVYKLDINFFRDTRSLQLILEHIQLITEY